MKACPFCAEEIQDAAIVCKHCGRDLAAPTGAQAVVAKKGGGAWMILVWVIGGFAVLVVVGAMLNDPKAPGRSRSAIQLLESATEDQRQSALQTVISGVGESCVEVTRTFLQGHDKTGAALWNATCFKGKSYLVTVNNDAGGSTNVLDCDILRTVARTNCFVK